jgi:hypothetical protein
MTVATSGSATAHTAVIRDPHVTVLFLGDSLALTLGIALGAPPLESQYDYTLNNLGILGCGVAEGTEVRVRGQLNMTAEPCSGKRAAPGTPLSLQPWPIQWHKSLAADHPNVGVLLAGRWEVVNRTYEGHWSRTFCIRPSPTM